MRHFFLIIFVSMILFSCDDEMKTIEYKNISFHVSSKSYSKVNLISALVDMTSYMDYDTILCNSNISLTYRIIKGAVIVKNILENDPSLFKEINNNDIDSFFSSFEQKNSILNKIDIRKNKINYLLDITKSEKEINIENLYSKYYDLLTEEARKDDNLLMGMMKISEIVHGLMFIGE